MLFVTNAFNLMDGGDGITGSLVCVALIGVNIIKISLLEHNYNFLVIALIGSLIPFLYFNLIQSTKRKIFLGDSGSLFLGYCVAYLLLYETQLQNSISPPFALWIIAIPIFDVTTVIIYRIKNSHPIFQPDRCHLHHFLGRFGFTNLQTLLIIFSFGIILSLLGFFIENQTRHFSFLVFLLVMICYVWLRVFSKYSKYNIQKK